MNARDAISEIQKEYFDILKSGFACFGWRTSGPLDPQDMDAFLEKALSPSGLIISASGGFLTSKSYSVANLMESVSGFWTRRAQELREALHQENSQGVVVQWGPDHIPESLSQYGAFFAHVFFKDPIMATRRNLLDSHERRSPESKAQLLRLALSQLYLLLCYERFFCPAGQSPLAVVVPSVNVLDDDALKQLLTRTNDRLYDLMSEMCGEEIKRHPESEAWEVRTPLREFFKNPELTPVLLNAQSAKEAIQYLSAMVVQDTRWGTNHRDPMGGVDILAKALGSRLFTLYSVASDSLCCAQEIGTEPYDWPLCNWLLAKEGQESRLLLGASASESDVFRFGVNSHELAWLSAVSPDDLMELRKAHSVVSIREDFRATRLRLRYASPAMFHRVAKEAGEFLLETLDKHKKKVAQLRAERPWNILKAGLSTGIWTAVGVAATCFAPIAIPGAVASILGGKSIYDFMKQAREEALKILAEEQRPLGILCALQDKVLSNLNAPKQG